VQPRFHPDGGRFLVKDYPKDREYRRLKLSAQITAKLKAHVSEVGLGPDDLLFRAPAVEGPHPRKLRLAANPDRLGRTKPNVAGRRYRHGTMTGYSLSRCRCDYCRDAYARYRAGRCANGKDDPRSPRSRDTDGHIPIGWFRSAVWRPAVKAANLEIRFRIHNMRYAHASWLLAGGADLQVVKERLGHGSLRTTERYLHKLSGIASAGLGNRMSAGQLKAPGDLPPRPVTHLTRDDARPSSSDARTSCQKGKINNWPACR
jgi:integrase